jgi:hypothetical protein
LDVRERIDQLDGRGYVVLDAITFDNRRSASLAEACACVAIDGKTYWLKSKSQQGLVSELISGRLAAVTRAGPGAQVLHVTPEVRPRDGSCDHIDGIVMGSEDEDGTVNSKDLGQLLLDGRFDGDLTNPQSRALVVAFQTWLGVGDAQVLVRLTDGVVMSIDHGDAFGNVEDRTDPPLVIAPIPGVADGHGSSPGLVAQAAKTIEGVSERMIAEAVAQVPIGERWKSPVDRRAKIAEYLIYRQPKVRSAMAAWR